jgi:hypothetical protein
MTTDPSLDFWLRAAESEGALHESVSDASVVLLPPSLQAALELPEEVTVTADPEVAREDGALLLAPGHPVLDLSAERVLERGDVARTPLVWPGGALPSAQTLVARMREQVQVDHGRIDASDALPVAGYAPVLRVGALVTYAVTSDDRFQERQEVWVDADSGLPLTAALSAGLAAAPTGVGLDHAVLPVDHEQAAAAAQGLLEQRSEERLAVLARQSQPARDAELARVQDYYRAVLDGLAKRSATASVDRRSLLEARADATRAERERRLAEVEEKFRGSRSIRWYRVHELLVPTARLAVTIRRGSREYPFDLRWLLPLQTVAPFRCPHCASEGPLVAGKHRLGCTHCLSRLAADGLPGPRPAGGPELAGLPVELPSMRPQSSAVPAPLAGVPTPRSAGTSPPAHTHVPPPAAPRPDGPRAARRTYSPVVPAPRFDSKRCADDGNRLALRFWEDVAHDDRKLARLVAPDSPAAAALRAWGTFGPALVLGVPAGSRLAELDAATVAQPDVVLQATEGRLRSPRWHYPYVLRWEGRSGRPGEIRVAEVVSGPAPTGSRLSGHAVRSWWRDPVRARPLPASRTALDPVAAALWRVELPTRGPYLLLRCLAAWWRTQAQLAPASAEVPAVAAALARLVAGCAGTQVTYDAVALQYAAEPAEVRTAVARLRPVLALSADRGW